MPCPYVGFVAGEDSNKLSERTMSDSEGLPTTREPVEATGAAAPAVVITSVDSQGFWAAIRESLRGSHRDYTTGPIGRSIILLAIPMVLEMCMESVFAVVDIKWVSYLGPDAMATVGLTESLLTLIYALAIGLSIGATATVAVASANIILTAPRVRPSNQLRWG
jgi:hypothetical protein